MKTYLERVNYIIREHGIKGARVCFEQAQWNSSDGNVKSYYHAHVQHDCLPDLNIGVGDSSFEILLRKIVLQIVPELRLSLNQTPLKEMSDKELHKLCNGELK